MKSQKCCCCNIKKQTQSCFIYYLSGRMLIFYMCQDCWNQFYKRHLPIRNRCTYCNTTTESSFKMNSKFSNCEQTIPIKLCEECENFFVNVCNGKGKYLMDFIKQDSSDSD